MLSSAEYLNLYNFLVLYGFCFVLELFLRLGKRRNEHQKIVWIYHSNIHVIFFMMKWVSMRKWALWNLQILYSNAINHGNDVTI